MNLEAQFLGLAFLSYVQRKHIQYRRLYPQCLWFSNWPLPSVFRDALSGELNWGKVFTSLILFLPSLPPIPLCFFPFLNHYHNLGFKTISIRQRRSHRGEITFMCGLNTAHKLLPGKENKNFALEHEEGYILLQRNYSTVLPHVLSGRQ